MSVLPLEHSACEGDPRQRYRQTASGGDVSVTMTWSEFGQPFAVEVGPERSATGEHDMYSLFLEARDAEITVNGRALGGQVVERAFFGRQMSSAFLAFSGTEEHEGFTVLIESRNTSIIVDGRALPGKPASRVQAGLETTTAFLYFSETWVWPP